MASVTQIIQRRRRRFERRSAAQRMGRAWLILALALLLLGVVLPFGAVMGGGAWMYGRAAAALPDPGAARVLDPMVGPTRLYARDGVTLLFAVEDPLGDARDWTTLDTLPAYLIDATLRMEDPQFMDGAAVGAAQTLVDLWRNLILGPVAPGSSLTARLVRGFIAPPADPPSAADREREIALTAAIERQYTRTQILEWHLNTNYYGNDAYGIEAAARVYLGKAAAELTLAEAALLAAIPPAPQYNPFDDPVAALGRRDNLLRDLLRAGLIDAVAYDLAVTAPPIIQSGGGAGPELAAEFAHYARRQAVAILDRTGRDGARLISRGGLRIITTLDLDLYYQSECALRVHLSRLAGVGEAPLAFDSGPCRAAGPLDPTLRADIPPDAATVVILDVPRGEILSMVGPGTAADYQPGPSLLPFVYFDGFLGGRTPAEMVLDIPRPFPGPVDGLIYTPRNPDGIFRGVLNLRDAMAGGLLPPAVQMANRQRIDNILNRAHLLGLNTLDLNARYDLSLLERGGSVSTLDVAYAYSVLSSMGQMRGIPVQPVARGYRGRDPVAVLRIEDPAGEVLWQYAGDTFEPDCAVADNCTLVYPAEVGYLINDVLSDAEARARVLGDAARTLDVGRPAAAVAGITGDGRDIWVAGYTTSRVVAVHMGRDDDKAMALDDWGFDAAAPAWSALMRYAHERDGLPVEDWARPPGIVELAVCERSGLLPNGICPTRVERFIEQFQPRAADTFWQMVEINSQTGQLATVNTQAGLRAARAYFIPPAEARDWWEANNLPLPPTEYDTVSRPELLGTATILQPGPFAYVGGVVDVRGSLDTTGMQYFQLAYGRGLNPDTWVQIGDQQTDFARGSSLGLWDTSALDGLYTLRLTVVMTDNSLETAIRQVTVDNIAPTLTLSAGTGTFRWPDERTIPLVAEVNDNLAIDRVEFYNNGEYIGDDREWPYGFEWQIARAGTERFSAVAFDAVGNRAEAEIEVTVIGRGG